MVNEELVKLTAQRTGCRTIIDDLIQKINATDDAKPSPDELEVHLQCLKETDLMLQDLNLKVLNLTEVDAIQNEMLTSYGYSHKITGARIKVEKILSESMKAESVTSSTTSALRTKLPDVTIKPFDGNMEDWPTFWDLYSSSIHDRDDMPDIAKFTYLRGLLRGEAEKAIKGYKTTAANYVNAVETLKKRFGDNEATKNMLIEQLIAVKPTENSNLENLQRLGDEVSSLLRSLQGLDMETESHAQVLIPVLCSKLSEDLLQEWYRDEYRSEKGAREEARATPLANFSNFLEEQINIRRRARIQRQGIGGLKPNNGKDGMYKHFKKPYIPKGRTNKHEEEVSASALAAQTQQRTDGGGNKFETCIFCEGPHASYQCPKAKSMEVSLKRRLVRQKNACFNCLRVGHQVAACRTRIRCKLCKARHNTLLHFQKEEKDDDNEQIPNLKNSVDDDTRPQFSGTSVANKDVLLMTVKGEIQSQEGNKIKIRCLFDNGSERSFLSKAIAKKIGCRLQEDPSVSIIGIGGNLAFPQEPIKTTRIRLGACNQNPIGEMSVLVINEVCGSVRKVPQGPWISAMKSLGITPSDDLEDYEGKEKPIDLLIGSDYYWQYVLPEVRKIKMGPMAIKTKLGWTLNGPMNRTLKSHSLVNAVFVKARVDDSIDGLVRSFWELEGMGINDRELNEAELLMEKEEKQRFASTTKQKEDQHYEVVLPKVNKALPECNKAQAIARLKQLMRKLEKTPEDLQRYHQEMQNLFNNNFAEKVKDSETDNARFYVPHRAVIRESSETTKVRIVFDGSARDSQGVSLNSCLATGPNLNPELVQLLLKYRTHHVALIADIEKAFLQVWIEESDRDLCRFFWYDDPNSESRAIVEYRMTRVLFGLNCSPYLLAATVKHHCEKYAKDFPKTVESLLSEMYVDDWVTGGDSVDDAFNKYEQGTAILAKGGFALRKWKTNSPDLHEKIYNTEEQGDEVQLMSSETSKILGLKWCTKKDALVYTFQDFVASAKSIETITKRTLLSLNMRIFDPLGLISPVVIETKLMVQDLWRAGIGWDQLIPEAIRKQWEKWLRGLEEAEEMVFPRHVGPIEGAQLHIFTDASVTAYAAVAYLRNETHGEIKSSLLASKTRVSPLKPSTIHRMELMGMVLGVRLAQYIMEVYSQIERENVHFWSDSQVCLHWVKNDPRRWKPFVSNRVVEIQEKTVPNTSHWRYCSGKENPADLPSRGATPNILKESLWLHGPEWLGKDESHWPPAFNVESPGEDADKEKRKQPILKNNATVLLTESKRISSFKMAVRVAAWVLRGAKNFKNKAKPSQEGREPLCAEEIVAAEKQWWKEVQRQQYANEIDQLQKGKSIKDSPIRDLNPFLDEEGLMRIRGRIEHSNLDNKQKHPIIINENHWIVPLFIMDCHLKVGHAGVNDTLVMTRNTCWMVRGRQVTKKYLRKCVVCRKMQGAAYNQEMAPLPKDRLAEVEPFSIIGMDFFGPLYLKGPKGMYKSYGLLITCASTRAVHLELLSSMNTDIFLQAFRRFISRRGVPSIVYSDNAKTFKKTSRLLEIPDSQFLHNEHIQSFLSNQKIQWKFIAERAPWWGGMWERLVRSVKTSARKKLQTARLQYEEMQTLLVEVEGQINSRPLTYVYSEPNEPSPISPSHLLIGRRVTAPPESISDDKVWNEPVNVSRRMRYRDCLATQFWRHWRHEYIVELKKSNCRFRETRVPKVGDICVIGDDNIKRCLWPLGVITELYTGRDAKIRSVKLRSKGKYITRPVQRLVPILAEEVPVPVNTPGSNTDQSNPTEADKVEAVPTETKIPETSTHSNNNDKCDLPTNHIGGECAQNRQKRVRRRPAYLDDYVQ